MPSEPKLERHFVCRADAEVVDRIGERLQTSLAAAPIRRARKRMVSVASGVAVVAMTTLVLFAVLEDNDAGPLHVAGSPPAPMQDISATGLEALDLTDGSQIVAAPGTELLVVRNTGVSVDLALARGGVLFDIEPGGPRRWSIDAGGLIVEVLGTRFEVVRSTEAISVEVERGHVRVSGERLARDVDLKAGDRFSWAPRSRDEDQGVVGDRESDDGSMATGGAVAQERVDPEAETSPPTRKRGASWRALAEEGDVHAAHRSLGSERLVRVAQNTRSLEDLFLLADVARRAGTPEEALVPLRRIADDYPGDPRSPLAVFTLGRILADQLGRHAEAGDAFAQAASLGLEAGLDTSARQRACTSYRRARRMAATARFCTASPVEGAPRPAGAAAPPETDNPSRSEVR